MIGDKVKAICEMYKGNNIDFTMYMAKLKSENVELYNAICEELKVNGKKYGLAILTGYTG